MRTITYLGCAVLGALLSFACAQSAFAGENLNEKYGANWDCSYMTPGVPDLDSLYKYCMTCDLTKQDFIQDTKSVGHCEPKMSLRDKLKKALSEPDRPAEPAKKEDPGVSFPVYHNSNSFPKTGNKSTITCSTCKTPGLPNPGVTQKIPPPPGFKAPHAQDNKSTITKDGDESDEDDDMEGGGPADLGFLKEFEDAHQPAPRQRLWGATAGATWRTGNGVRAAIGSALNFKTEEEARQAAISKCEEGGGIGCEAQTFNNGCGYIASGKGENNVAWGTGSTPAAAIAQCESKGASCYAPIGGCLPNP